MNKARLATYLLLIMLIVAVTTSCSTSKNTGMTRFWHAFTARYNTYFNGAQAYIEGSLEKENGNKDDYTERLPLYTVGNKNSRGLGSGNFDIAITKAEKAIQIHSIKTKPEWNKSRRKTKEDVEWLSRKEYNPFLWKAWMLMGRSQFHKGDFDEAAATFTYMSRLYKGQPAIYGKARAWLAKCYIESDWLYDAEDVIRNMMRDSIDWRARKEWDYTLCDYYLHTDSLRKASHYLRKVIKHEMRSKQRAREYYLLGQLEAAQGNRQAAYEAFRKVIRQHPAYELAFNARISMTEVLAKGQAKKMISRLKRMAHDDNNKDYLDQVYYAIGNIYLAEKDTANAIGAYEKGNKKATRSGIEKGVLLLHLGDLYWAKEKYGDAKRCYGEAIGLLDKDRKEYEQLSQRSKVLDELVPHTDAIELQDSLLQLSEMPEKERNEAIDRVIKELIKKEKEEEANNAEAELEKRQQEYGNKNMIGMEMEKTPAKKNTAIGKQDNAWYFYNTQAVTQGKQTFQRMWGRRENTDDWQRSNKTVVGDIANNDKVAATDSIANNGATSGNGDANGNVDDGNAPSSENGAQDDPHTREYYLAQIPFTEEQKAECHKIIKEALQKSAIIFKDKLDNLRLSEKQFDRLRSQYNDYEPKDEIYYHLFLLHSRKGDKKTATTFIDSLTAYCPESKYTVLLTDPYFEENARFGTHIEDSLYGATYTAFKEDRFHDVYENAAISETRFPLGANRDRFIFLYGMAKLNDGDAAECLDAMRKVVTDYPDSKVGKMAGMMINGVQAGRRLHGAKFDLTNVWNRRDMTLTAGDSTVVRTFTDNKDCDYLFVMAYAPDSLNENQLLFQMARYNFTSFMVRDFDITIDDYNGMHHMTVSGFRNFDEARQYSKLLLQQENIIQAMSKARPIIISEENLTLLGSQYSYNDYDTFYVSHFAPLPVERPEQLYTPTEVKSMEEGTRENPDPVKPILPTEDVAPGGAKPVDQNADNNDNDGEENAPSNGMEVAIPAETEKGKAEENAFDLPIDNKEVKREEDNSFDLPTENREVKKAEDNAFDLPTENKEVKKAEDNAFDLPVDNKEVKREENNSFDLPTDNKEVKKAEENAFDLPIDNKEVKKAEENAFDLPIDNKEMKREEDNSFDLPTENREVKKAEDNAFDLPIEDKNEKKAAENVEFDVKEDIERQDKNEDNFEFIDTESKNDNSSKSSEETFDFDEESDNKKDNKSEDVIEFDEEQNKKTTRDLEDEYYDLDGF